MQRKAMFAIEWKAEAEGTFRAILATFNVVDKDGDVTFPGAFPVGKAVPLSAFGHASWDGALPIGKGVIGANQDQAWIDGEFFTDTQAGADSYRTVKNLGALGQWSYGFQPAKTVMVGDEKLAAWPGAFRGLEEINVFEASPVLLGAGIGTVTQTIKSVHPRGRALLARIKATTTAAAIDPAVAAAIAELDATIDEADDQVDALMALLGIPDPDAGSEADDEGMAPGTYMMPLGPKGMTLNDQAEHARASVQGFGVRIKAIAALRRKDGRTLSASTRSRLTSHVDALSAALADIQKLIEEADPADGKAAIESVWLAVIERECALREVA